MSTDDVRARLRDAVEAGWNDELYIEALAQLDADQDLEAGLMDEIATLRAERAAALDGFAGATAQWNATELKLGIVWALATGTVAARDVDEDAQVLAEQILAVLREEVSDEPAQGPDVLDEG